MQPENKKAESFLTVSFNDLNEVEIIQLAKAFRSVLAADHVSYPNSSISVGLISDGDVGKTTFCENLLGVEIKNRNEGSLNNPIDWIVSWHNYSRVRVSNIDNLGTVVWMDAQGVYMDELDEKPISKENRDPNHYRAEYLKKHNLQDTGGVNVIEHPRHVDNNLDIKYYISLEKAWDDYNYPRDEPSPRHVDFRFKKSVYDSDVIQAFLDKVAHLNPTLRP